MTEDLSNLEKDYPDGQTYFVTISNGAQIIFTNKEVRETIVMIREKLPLVKAQLEQCKLKGGEIVRQLCKLSSRDPSFAELSKKLNEYTARISAYKRDIALVEYAIDKKLNHDIMLFRESFSSVSEDTEFKETHYSKLMSGTTSRRPMTKSIGSFVDYHFDEPVTARGLLS